MPHHLAPRLGSVCPNEGIAPWARREGPSMAQRGYLGIHAEVPTTQYLRSAIVVNGALRSTSTARRPSSRPGSWWDRVSPVGAGLLAKRPVHSKSSSAVMPPSRASSLPHWIFSRHKIHVHPAPPVGASLLAKRPAQSTSSLTEPPLSRASSLPHWIFNRQKIHVHHRRNAVPARARSAIRPPRGGR